MLISQGALVKSFLNTQLKIGVVEVKKKYFIKSDFQYKNWLHAKDGCKSLFQMATIQPFLEVLIWCGGQILYFGIFPES